MKLLLALFASLVTGSALAQEVAGRVLFSVGDVVLSRGTTTVTPGIGTAVLMGDTLRLGDQSHVQLRMTDESLIALQPNTNLEITEYAFAGKQPGDQRAFFRLAAGAMRTVTGLIGRIRQTDYQVQTPTATIGIRGTHYQIAHLTQPRGNLLAGTYGAVTDGRISVRNQGGERVFGADQHFHVRSANDPAAGRAGPPPRIGTVAPAPRQQQQQQQQQQARTDGAGTAVVASTGDARVSNASSGSTVSAAPKQDAATSTSVSTGGGTTSGDSSTVSAPVASQPAQLISITGPGTVIGGTTIVQPTLSGTVFYRIEGPFNLVPSSCGTPPCTNFVNGNIFLGVNLTLQRAAVSINLTNSNGNIFNFSTPSPLGGIPITVNNGQITFSQTVNLVDFPQNQGAFRCLGCNGTGGPSFAESLSVSGTISGSTASLTLIGNSSSSGGGGSITVSLPQTTPTSFISAAAITPQASPASANNAGGSYWSVSVDSAGRLLAIGPGSTTSTGVGMIQARVGTATNTIAGSAPTAGNLVWGAWTNGGSQITDFNYASFTTSSLQIVPWITGTTPNTLLPSLGTLTYTPVGSFVNGGISSGVLNSASLTADFVARTLSLSINASRLLSPVSTFQMNATNSFSPISGRFGGGFQSVTCTGPSCAGPTPGGSYNGFFAGPNAEGAGVAFTAGFGAGTGVSGVVGLKR